MMAFITHYLKKLWPRRPAWLYVAILLGLAGALARAQPMSTTEPVMKLERFDDALWLSTQLVFELPAVVEDALLKGIPIYFVAEVDVLRERWYWINRKISSVQRQMRLAYQPLTRRWRINITADEAAATAHGLALNQNFDSMQDALAVIRRISHWRVADAADLDAGGKYLVEFKFRLDVSQLPRPLQIGTLGQSDWRIERAASLTLNTESVK